MIALKNEDGGMDRGHKNHFIRRPRNGTIKANQPLPRLFVLSVIRLLAVHIAVHKTRAAAAFNP